MVNHLHLVVAILVIAGAINWGLVGLLNFNLVEALDQLVNAKGLLAKIIYILVGAAGVLKLVLLLKPDLL